MMSKRFSLLIVFFTICVLLCSCSVSSESALPTENTNTDIALNINQGIFDLSLYFPGFTRTVGCNYFNYRLKDNHLDLYVYDKTTSIESIQPGGIASFEKRSENGLDYYIRASAVCWDGIDEETGEATGGETTTTEILFYFDEYIVVLNGSTQNEEISVVTLELAMDLLRKAPIDGLEQLSGGLFTRLQNGTLECNISLIEKDAADYQDIFNTEGTVVQEEDNIRYLASIQERSPDDPNVSFIVCDTDNGAFLVSCGVPYYERNNVASEELDFINFSLAQDIAECLGVVIISISI